MTITLVMIMVMILLVKSMAMCLIGKPLENMTGIFNKQLGQMCLSRVSAHGGGSSLKCLRS